MVNVRAHTVTHENKKTSQNSMLFSVDPRFVARKIGGIEFGRTMDFMVWKCDKMCMRKIQTSQFIYIAAQITCLAIPYTSWINSWSEFQFYCLLCRPFFFRSMYRVRHKSMAWNVCKQNQSKNEHRIWSSHL